MNRAGVDAALDALFVPFASADLDFPADVRTLFLRARVGSWLQAWPRERFVCVQTFKPFADALTQAGVAMIDARSSDTLDTYANFQCVLLLPPRQREEARAQFARAVRCAAPDGVVVASVANSEGARSAEADLEQLVGPVRTLSKHKCRVFWVTLAQANVNAALLDEWAVLDAPQTIVGGHYVSRPGLFAWNRIDPASALLASLLPATLAGRVADLGAGYGYLATEVLRRCPAINAIDLYEAEQRALDSARINVERAVLASARDVAFDILWHDVKTGLPRHYDAIVCNPPFHQGRADQPELGQAFIAAAANALADDGSLWLVANRHLPYEATLAARFERVDTRATQHGFKVFEARNPRR